MKFAICDQDQTNCKNIDDLLRNYFRMSQIRCQTVETFYSGKELMDSPISFDIVFLGMEFAGTNGLEIHKQIKHRNPRTVVLFTIASQSPYEAELIENSFCYMHKPVSTLGFFQHFKNALSEYNTIRKKFAVKSENSIHMLHVSDIMLIEAACKKTNIYTADKVYESSVSISSWVNQLDKSCFFLTHKSYLVNFHFVTSFSTDGVLLNDGQYRAKITFRRFNEFKNNYILFLEGEN